jgi:photosystem II stability/assembly factor-like uncharacterized protein
MKTMQSFPFAAMLFIGIAGCSLAPAQTFTPTATPTVTPQPPPTETPTPSPDFGSWNLLQTIPYPDSVIDFGGFFNKSYGILVGTEGLVEYTTNSGQKWNIGINHSMCRWGLDIVDEKTAWNCGNAGHMRVTHNGAEEWEAVADFGPSEPDHCRYLSFLDATTGWAAGPFELGMTTDGATTWKDLALPPGTGKIAAISLRTPLDGYVLDDRGTLLATADGGKTWTSQPVKLPVAEKLGIHFAPTAALRFLDALHGRIVVLQKGGYQTGETVDGGTTWTWEPIPDLQVFSTLYLTHDARLLTAINLTKNEILLLQYPSA